MDKNEFVIYLDMDGVLSDFEAGARDIGYDLNPALNKSQHELSPEHRQVKENLYQHIGEIKFFENLPMMPGAQELWDYVHSLTTPIILTAAPNYTKGVDDPLFVKAAQGKKQWLAKMFAPVKEQNFICTLSHLKQDFIKTRPGQYQILIDDRLGNINRWVKAGGIGIHHKKTDQTIDDLLKLQIKASKKPL